MNTASFIDTLITTISLLTLFAVLGMLKHYFKFFTNANYRNESKLKDNISDKLDKLFVEIENCKTDDEINKKMLTNCLLINFNINNFREKVLEYIGHEKDVFPGETNIYTIITASIYTNSENQLKLCFKNILKSNFDITIKNSINSALKIIDGILECTNKEGRKSLDIINWNTQKIKYNIALKILKEDAKSQFVDISEFKNIFFFIEDKYDFSDIYNKIETDTEYENFCKKISENNEKTETYFNTMLTISVLEKYSNDINNNFLAFVLKKKFTK